MWIIAGLVIGVLLLLLAWDLAGQPTGRRWRRRRRDRSARLAHQKARKG